MIDWLQFERTRTWKQLFASP